jgi:outer membrane protein assembly factor BamB
MAWKRITAFAVAATAIPMIAVAGDWMQFRGPNNSGITESLAPTEWSTDKNVAWKEKIPGYGWSSPIVVGDKIIVTTAVSDKQKRPQPMNFGGGPGGGFGPLPGGGKDGPKDGGFRKGPPPGGFGKGGPGMMGGMTPPDAVYRWEIHCLDRNTGKSVWSQVVLERKPTIAANMGNGYASETPVSDGERVYAYFGMHGLFCYDLTGKKVWKKDLGPFKMMMGWGTGSSPALDGDRLFILCDNEEKSYIAAFDKKTGDELWKTPRSEKSNWSSPFVWRNKQRIEIIAAGGKGVVSYDPADGKVLWELQDTSAGDSGPGGNDGPRGGGRMGGMGAMSPSVNATPVGNDDMLFVGRGSPFGGSPMWAVKAGGKGDISLRPGQTSNKYIAWYNAKAGPPMASPLLYKDVLYIFPQNGNTLSCYDAKTGKEVYRQRLDGAGGFTSSPWAHDGKVYAIDQNGNAFVIQAGSEFKLLAKNHIEDMFWSSPAVASDALYLRGADRVYCVKQ